MTLEVLERKGQTVSENLAGIYANFMRFVTTGECMAILAITKNTIKGTGYDILTNSIWPEIAEAIKNLQPIFNPGQPGIFHKNYTLTMEFIADLEKQSASRKNLLTFRSSSVTVDFMQKLQQQKLPVYYQLSFKEISSTVEDVLTSPTVLAPIAANTTDPDAFCLRGAVITLESIQRCWSPDVFLFALSHRFWKLTLQLLARYGSWLQSLLPERAEVLGDVTEKVYLSLSLSSRLFVPVLTNQLLFRFFSLGRACPYHSASRRRRQAGADN